MNATGAGAPPLKVWVASLVVAGLLIAVPGLLEGLGLMSRKAGHLHALNLSRLQRMPAATLRVVAVGSSKMYYAIEYDTLFAQRLDTVGRKTAFTRISTSSPTGPEVAATLEALLATPPNLLLLESDLLLIDRHRETRPSDGDTWSGRLRGNLKRLAPAAQDRVLAEEGENFGRIYWKPESVCRDDKSAAGLQRYAANARRWTIASLDVRMEHRRSLRALQQAGTRVVLLELPRSPVAEPLVPGPFKKQVERLRQGMVEQEGYLAWTPGVLAESLYCDQGHLDRHGQAHYSDWLAGKLALLLADADG